MANPEKQNFSTLNRRIVVCLCLLGLLRECAATVEFHQNDPIHIFYGIILLAGISYSILPPKFPWKK